MPLDRVQSRKLVSAAESAYSRGIHSEFIGKIAAQLKEALEVVDTAAMESQRAQNEVARLQRELDEEKTHYRKLREESAHIESAVAVLREIAKSPKGAAKKATDQLALMGISEPVVVPPAQDKILVP